MKFSELVDSGAKDTEVLEYLIGGETVPVTVRIPENLRDSAKEAAAHRGMSFSSFVRMCLIQELSKRG